MASASTADSIRARALLLEAELCGSLDQPRHRLSVLLHERTTAGRLQEVAALEALVGRLLSDAEDLEEPHKALQLLLALADTATTPPTSRHIGTVSQRAAFSSLSSSVAEPAAEDEGKGDISPAPPPPDLFYPSALVPQVTLLAADGKPLLSHPAIRHCPHAEEQRRVASRGWAEDETAIRARLHAAPRPATLLEGVQGSQPRAAAAYTPSQPAARAACRLLGAVSAPLAAGGGRAAKAERRQRLGRRGGGWRRATLAARRGGGDETGSDAAGKPPPPLVPPTDPPPVRLRPPPLAGEGSEARAYFPGYISDAPCEAELFEWWMGCHFGCAEQPSEVRHEVILSRH